MPKRRASAIIVARGRIVEQRQHHQDRVGSGDPRLGDLAQVDEEVLGEDRPVELAPSGREIVERTAEVRARRTAR